LLNYQPVPPLRELPCSLTLGGAWNPSRSNLDPGLSASRGKSVESLSQYNMPREFRESVNQSTLNSSTWSHSSMKPARMLRNAPVPKEHYPNRAQPPPISRPQLLNCSLFDSCQRASHSSGLDRMSRLRSNQEICSVARSYARYASVSRKPSLLHKPPRARIQIPSLKTGSMSQRCTINGNKSTSATSGTSSGHSSSSNSSPSRASPVIVASRPPTRAGLAAAPHMPHGRRPLLASDILLAETPAFAPKMIK